MGTYPGASWSGVSTNKTRRNKKVRYFIIHHWAGTGSAVGQRNVFMRPNKRRVSCNWQVNRDGSVWEIVPPDNYRAWTTGSVDHEAVTVETQNSSGAPNWGITRASMEAIAQLVAWASKRYGFPIDRAHVFGHKETRAKTNGRHKPAATACPGPSMDLDWIVGRAREIAGQGGSPPAPKPSTGGGGSGAPIRWGQPQGKADILARQKWMNRSRGEKLVEDGIFGPATEAATKRYQQFLRDYGYTGNIDGRWGDGTQAAHQRYYDEFNGKKPSKPAPKPKPKQRTSGKLEVDGGLGPNTIADMQRDLGRSVIDGRLDLGYSPTVADLQRRLNAAGARDWDGKPLVVDGKGLQHNLRRRFPKKGRYRTIWALQKHLGIKPDGFLSKWPKPGSGAVREMQRRLNKGGMF